MSVAGVQARVLAIQSRLAALGPADTAAAPPPAAAAAASSASPFAASLQQQLAAGGPTAAVPAALPAATAGVAAAGSLGEPSPYDEEIAAAAAEAGVPAALLKAMCKSESGFNPRAVSHAGAQGLMQLMPGTARGLGVTDPFDPVQSLRGGARYLRGQLDRFGGDVEKAVAAYNAGPGAVQRHGGVPPYAETQAYVRRVLGYVRDFGGLGAAAPAAAPAAPTAAAQTYSPVLVALATSGPAVVGAAAPAAALPSPTVPTAVATTWGARATTGGPS